MFTLRAPVGPDATQRVRLEGREFVLRFRWLQRPARWALDVSSGAGELLAGGLRLMPNVPILRYVRGARTELPLGDLMIHDRRTPARMPTLESLGGENARIVYLTAAEVEAAA